MSLEQTINLRDLLNKRITQLSAKNAMIEEEDRRKYDELKNKVMTEKKALLGGRKPDEATFRRDWDKHARDVCQVAVAIKCKTWIVVVLAYDERIRDDADAALRSGNDTEFRARLKAVQELMDEAKVVEAGGAEAFAPADVRERFEYSLAQMRKIRKETSDKAEQLRLKYEIEMAKLKLEESEKLDELKASFPQPITVELSKPLARDSDAASHLAALRSMRTITLREYGEGIRLLKRELLAYARNEAWEDYKNRGPKMMGSLVPAEAEDYAKVSGMARARLQTERDDAVDRLKLAEKRSLGEDVSSIIAKRKGKDNMRTSPSGSKLRPPPDTKVSPREDIGQAGTSSN